MPAAQPQPTAGAADAVAHHVNMHVDAEWRGHSIGCYPVAVPIGNVLQCVAFAPTQRPSSPLAMKFDYDVVVIGGAFSGAATAFC